MTDADVDGAILELYCLLFLQANTRLIEKGYVYIAQPPLYKLKIGKKKNI